MKYTLLSLLAISNFILIAENNDHERIFTEIYDNATWGRNTYGEGFSGGGSLLSNCHAYIDYLEQFISSHHIRTVVDAGCGDWEFSRYMNWNGIEYIGYDIVEHVIEKNNRKYGSDNIRFVHANCLKNLPSADLLLCKHVLQHLTNEDILAFLPQLQKFKYCIITNEVNPQTLSSDNKNIATGGSHKIDLSRSPFNIKGTKVLNFRIKNTMHQVFLIDNTAN